MTDLWDRYLAVREVLAHTREELDHAKALNRDYEHKMQGVRETLHLIGVSDDLREIGAYVGEILDAWGKPCC